MVEMAACAAVQEGPRQAEQWHEDKSYSMIFQKGAQGVGSRCVPFMTNLIVVLTIIFADETRIDNLLRSARLLL